MGKAVAHVLIFALEGHCFALPAEHVVRALRSVAVTPLTDAPELILGAIDLAGELLPVVDLRRRLGFAPRPLRLSDRLLVVRAGERQAVFPVDEIREVFPLAPGQLLAPACLGEGGAGVAGVIRYGESLVLVEDLARLLQAVPCGREWQAGQVQA